MTTTRHRGVWAAMALCLCLLVACPSALADPALWVLHSPTATIYLFGTIHVLPKGLHWRDAALESAVHASGSLYVEADDDTRAHTTALIYRYGIRHADPAGDPDMPDEVKIYLHPDLGSADYVNDWSSFLKALERAGISTHEFQSVATHAGVPGGARTLELMQPWLAALTLSNAVTRKAGYLPRFGADSVLEHEFRAHDKPVFSFETTHDQIAIFANIPKSLQLNLLETVLGKRIRGNVQTASLVHDWLAGDTAAVRATVVAPMRERMPELYKTLLVDRNRDWARQITQLLTQHGTVFVAVGLAHLVGPDGIPAQLSRQGIHVQRVH